MLLFPSTSLLTYSSLSPSQGLRALGTESCVRMWVIMVERQVEMKPAGDQEFGVTVKLAVILGMSGWDEMAPGDVRQPGGPCIFAQISRGS